MSPVDLLAAILEKVLTQRRKGAKRLCFFLCAFAPLCDVITQSRVARELALVTFRGSHSHAEFARGLASPATRLNVRLRAPYEFQNVSQSLVRLIDIRIGGSRDDRSFKPAEVFIRDEGLLASETREIESVCTHSPRG